MRKFVDTITHPQAWSLYTGLAFIPLVLAYTILALFVNYLFVDIHEAMDPRRFPPEKSLDDLELSWYYYASFGHPWISLLLGGASGAMFGFWTRNHSIERSMRFAVDIERSLRRKRGRFQPFFRWPQCRVTVTGLLLVVGMLTLCIALGLSLKIVTTAMIPGVMFFNNTGWRKTWNWVMERAENGYIAGVSSTDIRRVKRRHRIVTILTCLSAVVGTIFLVVIGTEVLGELVEMVLEDSADDLLSIRLPRSTH